MFVIRRLGTLYGRRLQLPFQKYMGTKITMGDPIEHATGLEKRELLAKLAGNTDLYWEDPDCKVGTGTKDDPIQVKSAFDSRLVGCICNHEAVYPNWMWIHQDEPKRCECGRWFILQPAEAL